MLPTINLALDSSLHSPLVGNSDLKTQKSSKYNIYNLLVVPGRALLNLTRSAVYEAQFKSVWEHD